MKLPKHPEDYIIYIINIYMRTPYIIYKQLTKMTASLRPIACQCLLHHAQAWKPRQYNDAPTAR